MTKKEVAEKVLAKGHCGGIYCNECFIHRRHYDCLLAECKIISYLSGTHNIFRARVIAGKYLAELEDQEC